MLNYALNIYLQNKFSFQFVAQNVEFRSLSLLCFCEMLSFFCSLEFVRLFSQIGVKFEVWMKMFRQTDTLLFFGRLMEDWAVRDHSMCVYRESLKNLAYLIQFKGSDDCFIL